MTIYTYLERYKLDSDLTQEFIMKVFKNAGSAELVANKSIANFNRLCEDRGKLNYTCNSDKSYIKFDYWDEEGDQWNIIEIQKQEVEDD